MAAFLSWFLIQSFAHMFVKEDFSFPVHIHMQNTSSREGPSLECAVCNLHSSLRQPRVREQVLESGNSDSNSHFCSLSQLEAISHGPLETVLSSFGKLG